jgi:FtsP/CotA-like multicopper oxidase with cupredoxin domain
MAPGEVQRWRFIHAGIEQEQLMVWTDEAGNELKDTTPNPSVPQFFEIAKDGLATGDMKVQPTIDLYPGYRSDVLVQAPPLPAGNTEAVYHIKNIAAPPGAALRSRAQAREASYLATVVVRGRHRPMKLPDRTSLERCRPYQPVLDGELTQPTIGSKGLITFLSNDKKLPRQQNLWVKFGSGSDPRL